MCISLPSQLQQLNGKKERKNCCYSYDNDIHDIGENKPAYLCPKHDKEFSSIASGSPMPLQTGYLRQW